MKRRKFFVAAAAGLLLATSSSLVQAAPYASGITITGAGTTVNYILNEDINDTNGSGTLKYVINGGLPFDAPEGTAKGAHSFTIPVGATFSILADKDEPGFLTPAFGTLGQVAAGVPYDTATGTGTLISTLSNPLTKFNSPRGVGVGTDPNTSNFGTVYISNSAAATSNPVFGGRTANPGKGLYALKADQSDAFGYVDAAQAVSQFAGASANSPYRIFVGPGGTVYTGGFGDGASNVYRSSPDLSANDFLFTTTTATTDFSNTNGGTAGCSTAGICLPVGQNHGSIPAVYVEGSGGNSNFTVYTLDEDMTSAQLTRVNATDPKGTDNNRLWKYSIGAAATPYSTMPVAMTTNSPLINDFSIIEDLDRGPDGKFYVSENRSAPANSTGLFVLDANGNVLFDSQKATASQVKTISTAAGDFNHDAAMNAGDYVIWRKQLDTAGPDADANKDGTVDATDYNIWRKGNGLAAVTGFNESGFGDIVNDLYANVAAVAVSPDGKWLATYHINNTLLLTPLVGGIPDIANRLAITTGTATANGRDMAWDAAGNLHLVSSGQQQYLVLAPGGHTVATTSWNGTAYAFNVTTLSGSGTLAGGTVPEPGSLALILTGALAVGFGRRRR